MYLPICRLLFSLALLVKLVSPLCCLVNSRLASPESFRDGFGHNAAGTYTMSLTPWWMVVQSSKTVNGTSCFTQ